MLTFLGNLSAVYERNIKKIVFSTHKHIKKWYISIKKATNQQPKGYKMKWQKKLTKKELKHLRDHGITSLKAFQRTIDMQQEWRDSNGTEPCFDCKHIMYKLDIKPQKPEEKKKMYHLDVDIMNYGTNYTLFESRENDRRHNRIDTFLSESEALEFVGGAKLTKDELDWK